MISVRVWPFDSCRTRFLVVTEPSMAANWMRARVAALKAHSAFVRDWRNWRNGFVGRFSQAIERRLVDAGQMHGGFVAVPGAHEVGERFGRSATDSVPPQAVRGGGMRRHPSDSTNRSLAAFEKLQHIRP